TVIMTVFIDLSPKIIPVYKGDKILSAVFGGVLMGIGLALIFLRGATTGGVDILAKLMQSTLPQFSIGNLIMVLDVVVIISSAIVYQNIENAFFAMISIFFQSKTIDYIIYGFEKGRLIIVKSDLCDEILKNASNHLSSIYTINESENELICATHRYEAAKFHKIVKNTDKTAFIVTIEAGEIFGEGFENFNESS
ncbi:MAG: YitT family protein, partial [Clostridia bacterium]|nr:YitT family protein [Clostridia bacterium]